MDSTSVELARVIARASTTIPMRLWSVDSESALLNVAATSLDAGEDSGDGEGDDEQRLGFSPVSLCGFDSGSPLTPASTAESVEDVSTLDFLEALASTPPIDRRLTDVLIGLEAVSTSVRSDSEVDSLVSSSSRIGDEERHVKGEERREGDRDRDLERDVVRDVGRFGVSGVDSAGPGMTGDGVASGTVATGSSSQNSGISGWTEGMSPS